MVNELWQVSFRQGCAPTYTRAYARTCAQVYTQLVAK